MIKTIICTMFALLLLTCSVGCDDPNKLIETLTVNVTSDPVGGLWVNTVSSTYTVTYSAKEPSNLNGKKVSSPEGVDLKVYFTNENGGTYAVKETSFDASSPGGSLTITFTAPKAGFYLDKTFWAVFEWSDYEGFHTVTSGKAICTVK